MSYAHRLAIVAFGVVLIAGFNASDGVGAPAKKDADGYAKKLVGVWEGTADLGGKSATIIIEFKPDGAMTAAMGPFDLKGIYKVTKEDGKTVIVDTEMTLVGFDDPQAKTKPDKKTLKVVFDDGDNLTISKEGEKPEPIKLKRKK